MTACRAVADNIVFATCGTTSDYSITEFNLMVNFCDRDFDLKKNALSIKESLGGKK